MYRFYRGPIFGLVTLLVCLSACSVAPDEVPTRREPTGGVEQAFADHKRVFDETSYPSAQDCRPCHEQHYREWSVSSHAYAQISPVFNAMQATLIRQTNGTLGDFCIRCHTPIGMELGEPVFAAYSERSDVSNEGVTCIVCHSVDREYGKVSARFPLANGDIFNPVSGPLGHDELERVLREPDTYRNLVTKPGQTGRKIHTDVRSFFQMTEPEFCGRCHDVRSADGFRLEDAFSEYNLAHASSKGESCQDCHMGEVPGEAGTYISQPAAKIGEAQTRPRRHANHMVTGPDHSVVHPAIFPHNPEVKQFASVADWVLFDVEAGWGTDEFEDNVSETFEFPERWEWAEDRYDARELIDGQLALLEEGFERGRDLLKKGYGLGELRIEQASQEKLQFSIEVHNTTDGHAAPTGFIAERLVFLRVEVLDPTGTVVYRSGDLDPNGDLRDAHSLYVHNGELELDPDLFSLQSKFVIRNLRGGEREQVLTPNYSFDPLPFVRPQPRATLAFGRPRAGRLHKLSIEPLGRRVATYEMDSNALAVPGEYTIRIALIAGMVPVNLIAAIQDSGFDFGLKPSCDRRSRCRRTSNLVGTRTDRSARRQGK